MSSQKFLQEYKKLNQKQKEAVDTIEGPVMVIAGPGTGKTQILTLRIANVLRKTDASPDSILALTFTEAAAANMRRRLVSIIGSTGYYVNIFTFHGFCNHIINEYPERFERIIGFSNASEVDQIDIIRSITEKSRFKHLKPFGDPFFYVPHILGAIRNLKKEGLNFKVFRQGVKKEKNELLRREDLYHTRGAYKGNMKVLYQRRLRQLEKNEELARAYEFYQKELERLKLYDFEDMILEVIHEFEKNKNFLLEIQENYQYILVDEHQDTNGAQNNILEFLTSFFSNPNLFVVGDEKQAIFRFQGASLDNFLYFKDKFKDVKLITLKESYRSTQAILDASQSVIEKNRIPPLSKSLTATRYSGGEKIQVHYFATDEAELLFIADSVQKLIEEGVLPHEIAVLYRENKDVFPVAQLFERMGIPYVIESDQDVLSDPEIKKLNLLFEAINEFGDSELLVKALHIDFLAIDPLDIYTLLRVVKKRKQSIYQVLKTGTLKNLKLKDASQFKTLYRKLASWHTLSFNENFPLFFETIVRESGFLNHLLGHEHKLEKLAILGTLFDDVRRIVLHHQAYTLKDYVYYLRILRDHHVMIKTSTHPPTQVVRLMTAHKAKGLEFDFVFIVGVYDGHWGNKRVPTQFILPQRVQMITAEGERNEDERRLFYMALTRARELVHISFARFSRDEKERIPSQFVGEIKQKLMEEHKDEYYDQRIMEQQHLLFAPRIRSGPLLREKDFVKERFFEQGLSPTALNNFMRCPWTYYFVNLVRIPLSQTHTQMYGVVVHRTLQEFFNAKKRGKDIGARFLKERFLLYLGKMPVGEHFFEELREKGTKTLPAYFRFYQDTWNYNTVNEYRIQGVNLTPEVKLTGMLDKLEIGENPRDAVVVDYKTKKPESRNWIEGKTKNSTGDFKRQLVFYKLLLDLKPRNTYTMRAGVIDFVEPNNAGVFKREMFEIQNEEVDELKELIQETSKEILTLSFWDKRCDNFSKKFGTGRKCEYCALREMMK